MKSYLPVFLALVCAVLGVSLVITKRSDNAQHEKDVGAIVDYSNRLDSAHMDIAIRQGSILALSNHLEECQSTSLQLSNQLAQSIVLNAEQITNLNQRVAEATSENQVLAQRVMNLTNQVAGLTLQVATTKASLAKTNQALAQARKDYQLLGDRLRMDVAERLVVERRFNNRAALQTQLKMLEDYPVWETSAESIYAGLHVEVQSNGTFRVLSSD